MKWREAKKTYVDNFGPIASGTSITMIYDAIDSLDNMGQKAPPVKAHSKKKEKTMCYDDFDCCETITTTPEERKADWLIRELDATCRDKREQLRKAFRMDGTPSPKTAEDFFNRIKTGKFSIPKKWLNDDGTFRKNNNYYDKFDPWNAIAYTFDWETPETAPDKEGYEAAEDKLDAAYKDTQRIIQIDTPMNGLAALKEFEGKTFH